MRCLGLFVVQDDSDVGQIKNIGKIRMVSETLVRLGTVEVVNEITLTKD